MPRQAGIAPFQCCTPDVFEMNQVLNLNGPSGTIVRNAFSVQQVGVGADYVVDDDVDFVILVDTTAARQITLPALADGKLICVKDSTGNATAANITIVTVGAPTIDGAANLVLALNDDGVVLICDAANWNVLAGV